MFDFKALIIDDDSSFAESIKRMLAKWDIEAKCLSDLDQLNSALEVSYDLILIDCFMPSADGFSVAEQVSNKTKESPKPPNLFLMSGIIDENTYSSTKSNNPLVKGFIKKPFTSENLLNLISDHMDIQQRSPLDILKHDFSIDEAQSFLKDFKQIESLEAFTIALWCSQKNLSGVIQIESAQSEAEKTSIKFHDGYVTQITCPNTHSALGNTLVENGYLSEQELETTLKQPEIVNKSIRIGTYLSQKNLISPHAIDMAIRAQSQSRLKHILTNAPFSSVSIEVDESSDSQHTNALSYYEIGTLFVEIFESADLEKYKKLFKQVINSSPLEEGVYFSDFIKNPAFKGFDLKSKDLTTNFNNLLLLLCLQAVKVRGSESTKTGFLTKKQEIENLKDVVRSGDPYKILNIDPSEVNDNKIAASYHKIAKWTHPDKIKNLNLSDEEAEDLSILFKEVTKAFNLIKTESHRLSHKNAQENEKVQKDLEAKRSYEQGKALLISGKYSDAYKKLLTIHQNGSSVQDLDLYFMWAKIKTKNLKQEEVNNFNANSQHRWLNLFIKALIEKEKSDFESFVRNMNMCLKEKGDFLPARRELLNFQASQKKQKEKPSLLSFFKRKKAS